MLQHPASQPVVDALGMAMIATDPDGIVVAWNAAAEQLYGWTRAEAIGRSIMELTPAPDMVRHAEAIMSRLRSGETWEGTFGVRRRDGTVFLARVIDAPIRADDGSLIGIVGLSEPAREAEVDALAQRRLEVALWAAGIGTWDWDAGDGRVRWDTQMESLYGLEPGAFDGAFDTWVGALHPEDRQEVLDTVQRSMAEGLDHEVEHRVVLPNGAVRWIAGRGIVTHQADGTASGMVGVAYDVTSRRRLRDAGESARNRLGLLSQAGLALVDATGVDTVATELVRILCDGLADWCSLDLLVGGRLELAALHAASEGQRAVLLHLRGLSGTGMEGLREAAANRLTVERDGALHVPLLGRQRCLGVLSLARRDGLDEEDRRVAEELARRAAAAIDRMRLFEERDRLAHALQRTLLPPTLPRLDGVELAAAYVPSGRQEVSGDFYDVFENPDGSWTALVGDVCGKGPEAAALTGLIRHTVRGLAVHEQDPALVLEALNTAMVGAHLDERFCTAVCAVFEPGERTRVRLAGVGAPAAMVVGPSGQITELPSSAGLLGVFEHVDVRTRECRLTPGETLVLYTDGLVEARHGDTWFGRNGVRYALGAPHASAAAMLERLLDTVRAFAGPTLPDDVAALALRQAAGTSAG